MKMLEDFKHVQQAMSPGVITADGFLGEDKRPLADIIAADELEMNFLEIEFEAMVRRMRVLLEAGMTCMGKTTIVEDKWIVVSDETRGTFPSPWNDGIFRKESVHVELLDGIGTGLGHIVFNELSLHLIEKFHFFQGKGSRHRLEPAVLKSVLLL